MKKVSVIVPILNEEANIKELVQRINKSLKDYVYEIIFIDDHSTDGSVKLIQKLRNKYPLKVFIKKAQKGKSFSILEAIPQCTYSTLILIDGDLQCPPEAIPQLIHKMEKGYDIVVANRKVYRTNFIRKTCSKIFVFLFAYILHDIRCDAQSGLKLVKKSVFTDITLTPKAWTLDLELLIKARKRGYTIGTISVPFDSRRTGSTKLKVIPSLVQMVTEAIKLRLSMLLVTPLLLENYSYAYLEPFLISLAL